MVPYIMIVSLLSLELIDFCLVRSVNSNDFRLRSKRHFCTEESQLIALYSLISRKFFNLCTVQVH